MLADDRARPRQRLGGGGGAGRGGAAGAALPGSRRRRHRRRSAGRGAPSLGLDIVVRLDGFAWMFAMLVVGMGLLVVVYARYYLSPEDPGARFHSLLLGLHGRDAGRGAGRQPAAAGACSGS
ncbi:MAG: hypothetical protein MZW92_28530 [Comamonadaceae bacterium]|nr:hypothetical protein [Comamonadaceae bacterium]